MTIRIDLSNLGDPNEPFNDDVIQALGKSLSLWMHGHADQISSIDPSVTVSVDTPEELSAELSAESTEKESKGDTHE